MKTINIFKLKVGFIVFIGMIFFLGLTPLDSQANGKIIFTSVQSGNTDIWIMNDDGSSQQQITNDENVEKACIFSPNGLKIAYVDDTSRQLIIMDVNGSNKKTIYYHPNLYGDGGLEWHPDGSKLLFVQGWYLYMDIWVINSDGSNAQNLTQEFTYNGSASYSPNGLKIVYSRRDIPVLSSSIEIWIMNADGTSKTKMTFGGIMGWTSENDVPDWSPDGTRIVYSSGQYGKVIGNFNWPHDLYLMDPEGSNKVRITTYPGWDYSPVWSPDGTKIVYKQDADLFTINSDGTGLTRLTFTNNNNFPDWGISSLKKVHLDIKPQSCPNPVNINKNGVLPVAILGTEDFNVADLNPASIALEGVIPIRSNFEDVSTPLYNKQNDCECTTEGPDGFIDLTLKFDSQEIISSLGEINYGELVVLTITGELYDGTPIEGKDCIIVLSKGKKGKNK